MKNSPQYWSTCIPLRVRVLGILFSLCVFLMLALLGWYWKLAYFAFYLCVSTAVLCWLIQRVSAQSLPHTFTHDAHQRFMLLDTTGWVTVRVTHIWSTPFFLALHCVHHQEKKQLIFWRDAMSFQAWRQLQIYILHYQLQYQFTECKGT